MSLVFNSSTFQDDTLIANNDIVSDMAGVERAIRSYSTVVANSQFGKLAGWKRWSSMKYSVIANARKESDVNAIDISPNDGVVPDCSKSLDLHLTDDSGTRCDPILLSSWLEIVEWQLHPVERMRFLNY